MWTGIATTQDYHKQTVNALLISHASHALRAERSSFVRSPQATPTPKIDRFDRATTPPRKNFKILFGPLTLVFFTAICLDFVRLVYHNGVQDWSLA